MCHNQVNASRWHLRFGVDNFTPPPLDRHIAKYNKLDSSADIIGLRKTYSKLPYSIVLSLSVIIEQITGDEVLRHSTNHWLKVKNSSIKREKEHSENASVPNTGVFNGLESCSSETRGRRGGGALGQKGSSTSYSFEKLFWWESSWIAISIPHQNSCTLKLKIYAFLATHHDICLVHVGVNTCKTARAILISMELNLSGTFEQII